MFTIMLISANIAAACGTASRRANGAGQPKLVTRCCCKFELLPAAWALVLAAGSVGAYDQGRMEETTYALFGPSQAEYPGRYVLRRVRIQNGQVTTDRRPRGVHPDPDVLRKLIPRGLRRRERSAGDDPALLETWQPAHA